MGRQQKAKAGFQSNTCSARQLGVWQTSDVSWSAQQRLARQRGIVRQPRNTEGGWLALHEAYELSRKGHVPV